MTRALAKPAPLKVAVAGTGYFSGFHLEAWQRVEGAEIVGLAGLDAEALRSSARAHDISATFLDVAQMLDAVRPDLLDVITPPSTHLPLIKEAVKRGIDVICQKPFCGDLETARLAVGLAESTGIKLTVHENFRFQPWYRKIADHLKNDRLGQLYRAFLLLRPGDGQGDDAYLARQPYFREMQRFLVHETLVHLIDVARYLFGEPNSVYADLARFNPVIKGEDSALIILGFENGFRVIIDGNRSSDQVADNPRRTMSNLSIEGEKGTLTMNGDAELFWREFGTNENEMLDYEWNDTGFGGDCVYLTIGNLVAHYREGGSRANDAADYLKNLEIEEAVYRSAKSGQRVMI